MHESCDSGDGGVTDDVFDVKATGDEFGSEVWDSGLQQLILNSVTCNSWRVAPYSCGDGWVTEKILLR